jgi:hypothetical protein
MEKCLFSKDEGLVFVEVWVFVFIMGIWLVGLLVMWLSGVGCNCGGWEMPW